MTILIADIETDGLLEEVSIIHSVVYEDFETGVVTSCNDHGYEAPEADRHLTIAEGLEELRVADKVVYHNGIKYDIPVQHKLHGWEAEGEVEDTLVMSRLIWSNIKDGDMGRVKRKTMPGKFIGSHSLEAWGYRLKRWKGDYAKERAQRLKDKHERMGLPAPTKEEITAHVWGTWNAEMQDYCVQDVAVTADLYRRILAKNYSQEALDLEHATAEVCAQLERNGFPFNEEKAAALYGTLAGKRAKLEMKLQETFGTWVESLGEYTPKGPNSAHGHWGTVHYEDEGGMEVDLPEEAFTQKGNIRKKWLDDNGVRKVFTGATFTKIKFVTFNPASRYHIANRLKNLYGWEPTEFTPSGDPKIDETVLEGLDYPTAPLLNEYFLVQKRLGQLAEGNQAWLKVVRDGKIHGSINPNGAVTGRATHSFPNVAQVPKVKVKKFKKGEEPEGFIPLEEDGDKVEGIVTGLAGGYGYECRSLFTVPEGWTQVGTDMSGLELRCLSHFMARWDDGEYGRIVLEGDVHTANQAAAGLSTRDQAKTFAYAYLYGAGDAKLGSISGGGAKEGKRLRANFQAKLPALGKLSDAVKKKAKSGSLGGLDKRQLHVRSSHSALNTLLQSAGALLCKRWIVLMDKRLRERGFKHGWDGDYAFLAWVHDELQIAARTEEIAKEIGELSNECAREAGELFNFRLLLEADYKIGSDWAWCH